MWKREIIFYVMRCDVKKYIKDSFIHKIISIYNMFLILLNIKRVIMQIKYNDNNLGKL